MTLPNASSPSTSETVSDIVTHIQENLAYLDTLPTAYAVKILSKNVATGDESETVTCGFKPRTVLLFYISANGSGGVGYYGHGEPNMFTFRKNRIIVGGAYSSDTYNITVNKVLDSRMDFDGLTNVMYGTILPAKITSNGFVLDWDEVLSEKSGDTYYVVALCMK